MALSVSGCGLTLKAAETASLEAVNAAIVAAAQEADAAEAREEAVCDAKPAAEVQQCVAAARRWNVVLQAYDVWRLAWSALVAVWNQGGDDAALDKARAKVETARSAFWLSKVAAEAGR